MHRRIRHREDGRQCEHGEPGRLVPEAHTRQLSSRRATEKAKAGGEPLRNTYLDRIRVDSAFAGDKELDRPRATFKPDSPSIL